MVLIFIRWNILYRIVLALAALLFYNEFLIYYITMLKCQWPSLSRGLDINRDVRDGFLKVMVLSDVHLLGSREGHWFDKIRREWQMEQSFQSSMRIHEPDAVFILGDIFDEGKWCSDSEFLHYVTRFRKMFAVPHKTSLHVLIGNHDIGFHYMVDDHKRHRFEKHLGTTLVQKVNLRGNIFVLINSMAMEEDRCRMCAEAESQLEEVYRSVQCCWEEENDNCPKQDPLNPCLPPILLSHFPLYRLDESACVGPDAAPDDEKGIPFKQKYDCLGREVTQQLLYNLKPRLVLSGHTHHFCVTNHTIEAKVNDNSYKQTTPTKTIPEWTVPSFSWRYKNNPSFLMISLNNKQHHISKCFLPRESTVVLVYIVVVFLIFFVSLVLRPLTPCCSLKWPGIEGVS